MQQSNNHDTAVSKGAINKTATQAVQVNNIDAKGQESLSHAQAQQGPRVSRRSEETPHANENTAMQHEVRAKKTTFGRRLQVSTNLDESALLIRNVEGRLEEKNDSEIYQNTISKAMMAMTKHIHC